MKAVPAPFATALAQEGHRGVAARWAVLGRWGSYLATVLLCAAVTHASFGTSPTLRLGGVLMLLSVAVIVATAAAGTWFFSDQQEEIIRQCRQFVFAIVVFPGTGLAVLTGLLRVSGLDPSGQDAFVNMLNGSIPWLYVFATIIPMVVFIKLIAGMRSIHTSRLEAQEEVALYTRQDGWQR